MYGDQLELAMRTYFEKPRTVVGWKGLIPDPNRDKTHDKNKGLLLARDILCVINDSGAPCTSELLNPITPQYIDDLLAFGSIGARNVESQPSRELGSGVSFAMGFKNGTRGGIDVAAEGMEAASHSHHLDGIDEFGMPAQFVTKGNKHVFMILRGSKKGPNYYQPYVNEAVAKMHEHGFVPRLMVDCSHKNKDRHTESQMPALEDTARQIAEGNASIIGVMIESNLVPGRQSIDAEPLIYGQSVTDFCEGLEQTEIMLEKLARAQEARRKA
jgi:3-deoxy-7-phosphoheptulonate synthase